MILRSVSECYTNTNCDSNEACLNSSTKPLAFLKSDDYVPKKQKGMTSAGRIYCKFVVQFENGNDILNFITWKNGKGMEINLKTMSKILLETNFQSQGSYLSTV